MQSTYEKFILSAGLMPEADFTEAGSSKRLGAFERLRPETKTATTLADNDGCGNGVCW